MDYNGGKQEDHELCREFEDETKSLQQDNIGNKNKCRVQLKCQVIKPGWKLKENWLARDQRNEGERVIETQIGQREPRYETDEEF